MNIVIDLTQLSLSNKIHEISAYAVGNKYYNSSIKSNVVQYDNRLQLDTPAISVDKAQYIVTTVDNAELYEIFADDTYSLGNVSQEEYSYSIENGVLRIYNAPYIISQGVLRIE